VLRGVLIAAIVVALQAAGASGAPAAPQHITTSLTATGEITKLGPSHIAISGLRCTVPAKLAVSAGRFVIGDPVKISCLNGSLRSVKYSPELATAQSTAPGAGNAPTTTPIPPRGGFDPSTATRISYSVGTLFLGGGPTGATVSASGPISDLSNDSVTVADLTCSFNFGAQIYQVARIGDNVTLTCTGGALVHMVSVGTVTRST
jgi:hypothetical protein